MIKTYFKIAIRSLLKNKLGTGINLLGFSVGLAVAMLILTYVHHEMSYDTFHEHSERICRINVSMDINGDSKIGNITPNILGPKLKEEIPEVVAQFRMTSTFNNLSTLVIDDRQVKVDNFFSADSTIFDVFSFKFIKGYPGNLLKQGEDVLVSRKTAMKYFGSTDIVGNTFRSIDDKNYIIRAIYDDFPSESHIHPNFIASSLSSPLNQELKWDQINYLTFILINQKSSIEKVEATMDQIVELNLPAEFKSINVKYDLIPLEDIHLYSKADFELEPSSNINQLYAYLAIAAFIMLIACVNYINLATSRALERAKEVGLKKVVGAHKLNLIWQFLIEAYLITFLSFILAVGLFELSKTLFTSIVGRNIELSLIADSTSVGILIVAWLVLALVAGFYPSLVLTSFQPVQILKGNFRHSKYGSLVRKSLVVFQFVISSALIVGTLIVYNQINYMRNKKLGFAKDQLLILAMERVPDNNTLITFKKELLQHNNIQQVSFSSAYPGKTRNGMLISAEGMAEDEQLLVWNWHVDPDYLKAMDMELIAGKDFNKLEVEGDELEYIINETALHDIGWDLDNCIGRKIEMGMWKGICIGVIKDFNFSSLQQKIEPLVLDAKSTFYKGNVMVRFGKGDISSTIDFIESKWQMHIPESAFTYNFLDETFDRLFASEQRTGQAFTVFSVLSIFIASLGLFGLSAYDTLSRTKEIGIRKSIGSSNIGIFTLLVKQFSKLALFAFLISIPIAYLIMTRWLQEFAYRTSIGWFEFGIAAIITLVIVLISIGYHAIKASRTNPVDSLRYE